MDLTPVHSGALNERLTILRRRGMRLAARLAIAFGLSTLAAILLGAAVTDNALVQIAVTLLAAVALWLPFLILISRLERLFARSRRGGETASDAHLRSEHIEESWRRLFAIAPAHRDRLAVLRRSLDRSRLALGSADLDPDAHDLCVLIDRRLPELIERELDTLPPDDRNRGRQLSELIDLIEQFARHCSRHHSSDRNVAAHEAAVLRRRFEARLSHD